MGAVTDVRAALADAVTVAGLPCTPYPPDALSPPAAFVDSLSIDFAGGSGFSFCLSGLARGSIVTVAQRNDKAGATQFLEDLMGPILEQLEEMDGMRVVSVDSGTANVSGVDLPSVVYSVEFGVGISS